MKNNSSLFRGYCILLFTAVFGGVMLLSWFQTGYLVNKPQEYLSGLKITMMITAGLTVMIAVAIFIVTRPFQEIFSRFKKTGEPLDEDDIQKVVGTYRKMNVVSVVGTIIGFALGNGITVLVKFILGKYHGTIIHVCIAMTQAIIYAGFVSIVIVYVTDFMFAKFRQALHIYDISKFKLGWSIAKTIRITTVICFLFIIANVMMVAFSSFNAAVADNINDYVKKIIIAAILNLIPASAITLLMLNTLNSRIATSEQHIRNLAAGTATDLIDITNIDDFGRLTSSTNELIQKQRTLVQKINHETKVIDTISETLEQVSSEATDSLKSVSNSYEKITQESRNQKNEISDSERSIIGLTDSVRDVEKHVIEEAGIMQENSAAITEMTENINSLAGMTAKADEVSKNLSQICAETFESLSSAITAIQSIQAASNDIVKIVKEIQKISSQTNMLAMNAAIEAAHAGQFGAGFAVVADEVRSLATSSSSSAKDIQLKIKDMVNRIDAGVGAIGIIEEAFKKIEGSVQQNAEISANIAQALREQQIGAENNLRSTRLAADDTNEIKTLVTSQHAYTTNVESSMKNVIDSTDTMADAISIGTDATKAMQVAVDRINETVKSNKAVVEELKKLMEEYSK